MLGKPAPQTDSYQATPKRSEDPRETDSCLQLQNVSVEFQTNNRNVFYVLKSYES